MKKTLIITSTFIIITILIVALYSNHAKTTLNEYMKLISHTLENNMEIQVKDLEIERVIKKSPKEIIILVEWDDNSALISIKDWLLPSDHDEMEIRVFNSKKGIKYYE